MDRIQLVKNAMLAVQRYPWEQGVCMQALYEIGDINTAIAMAHDAVLRQKPDGRLAVISENIAVTDPAANGEVVFRAYEITEEKKYFDAAGRMLDYLMKRAPRTDNGTICHNEVSFQSGFSPYQIWADSIYMAPPFLALMGELDEAVFQINHYFEYLIDEKVGLLRHIYDAGTGKFVRDAFWATGNGWALMGLGRVIDTLRNVGRDPAELVKKFSGLLDSMLRFQLADGRFHDILDDDRTFVDGTSAMMMAASVYRGIKSGWLSEKYYSNAKKVSSVMDEFVDKYGIIHGVCGCPDFLHEGTSAESMAAYLLMKANEGD